MEFEFSGELWYWKGPSPFHFISVPEDECEHLHAVSEVVTYGWGMIPVTVRIGKMMWKTSLWPKNGQYIVPLKADVRRAEKLSVGDTVAVRLSVEV